MAKKIELQAVSLTFQNEWSCDGNDSANVNFVYEGARYHVWLATNAKPHPTKAGYKQHFLIEPLQVKGSSPSYGDKAVLHKNPLVGIKKGDIGYFPHVALRANSATWRKIIEQAFSCVNVATARAAYIEAYKAKEAKQEREYVESLRAERIAKFAPSMYELLFKMRDAWRDDQPFSLLIENADELIAAIDKAD